MVPGSTQLDAQPSPPTVLPSSQVSPRWIWMSPSPHTAIVQALLHASMSMVLPSSHSSSPSITPLPQSAGGSSPSPSPSASPSPSPSASSSPSPSPSSALGEHDMSSAANTPPPQGL